MKEVKQGVTIRTIKGLPYCCRDVGCPDFEAAKRSREKVADKLCILAYLVVENTVRHTPLKHALPAWVPLGNLPSVDKKDWQQHGGGSNMFTVGEDLTDHEGVVV